MKTPLGMEVELGLGHIVFDGVPALRDWGTAAPALFGPCLLRPRSPISATAETNGGPKTQVAEETLERASPIYPIREI